MPAGCRQLRGEDFGVGVVLATVPISQSSPPAQRLFSFCLGTIGLMEVMGRRPIVCRLLTNFWRIRHGSGDCVIEQFSGLAGRGCSGCLCDLSAYLNCLQRLEQRRLVSCSVDCGCSRLFGWHGLPSRHARRHRPCGDQGYRHIVFWAHLASRSNPTPKLHSDRMPSAGCPAKPFFLNLRAATPAPAGVVLPPDHQNVPLRHLLRQ